MANAGSSNAPHQSNQQHQNNSGRTFQNQDYPLRLSREDGSTSNISTLNGLSSTTSRKNSSSSLQTGFYSNLSTSPSQTLPPVSSPSLPTLPSNASLESPLEMMNHFQNSQAEVADISEQQQLQREPEERERVGLGLGSIAESSSVGSIVNISAGVESSANGGVGSSAATAHKEEDDLIPVGFDEGILRALCDSDVRQCFLKFDLKD